jgi:hypothetical protein
VHADSRPKAMHASEHVARLRKGAVDTSQQIAHFPPRCSIRCASTRRRPTGSPVSSEASLRRHSNNTCYSFLIATPPPPGDMRAIDPSPTSTPFSRCRTRHHPVCPSGRKYHPAPHREAHCYVLSSPPRPLLTAMSSGCPTRTVYLLAASPSLP